MLKSRVLILWHKLYYDSENILRRQRSKLGGHFMNAFIVNGEKVPVNKFNFAGSYFADYFVV